MKTIKLIDVLNMLANGEKIKFKIKQWGDYFNTNGETLFDEDGSQVEWRIYKSWLNEEVEIIEEDKDIESIETYKNYLEKANEKYDSGYLLDVYLQGMSQRLIELIDIVNDLKKKGKSD